MNVPVPVHATNCIFNFIIYIIYMEMPKKGCFVVKQYAVGKTEIRPYAVCRLKIKQSTRYTRRRVSLSVGKNSCLFPLTSSEKIGTVGRQNFFSFNFF